MDVSKARNDGCIERWKGPGKRVPEVPSGQLIK